MASHARPEHAAPLRDNDPRHRADAEPLQSSASLRERLRTSSANWLIVRRERAASARPIATERAQNATYLLLQVRAP